MATVILTIGDAGTYPDISDAWAAIPATITDDYELQVGAKAAGYSYSANLTLSVIDNSNGQYKIKVIGMAGNVADDNQISLVFTGGSAGVYVFTSYGVTIENLKINSTVGRCIYGGTNTKAKDCRTTNTTNLGCMFRCFVEGCIVDAPHASAIAINTCHGAVCSLIKSGNIGITSNYESKLFVRSTIYGGNLAADMSIGGGGGRFSDCILLGGNYAVAVTSDLNAWRYLGIADCILYSIANPTEFASGLISLDQAFPMDWNSIIADPKLALTGSDLIDFFTPDSDSPCRPENQSSIDNPIVAGKERTPVFIGGWSDYTAPDFPSTQSVLTTDTVNGVAGEYINPAESIVKLGEDYGYNQTGTYAESENTTFVFNADSPEATASGDYTKFGTAWAIAEGGTEFEIEIDYDNGAGYAADFATSEESKTEGSFFFEIDTTLAGSASDTFIIPTTGSGYDATVYWGDGESEVISGTPGNVSHTYDTGGTKYVRIVENVVGGFPRIYFYGATDAAKLTEILEWGDIRWSTFANAFRDCVNLSVVSSSDCPNLTYATSLNAMFRACTSLTDLTVRCWDLSNINDIASLFNGCSDLTGIDVSQWDTSNVTSIGSAFRGCSSLVTLDVSGWDTSKMTSFGQTFNGCALLEELNVANWDTSNVTTIALAFTGANSLTLIGAENWNTVKLTNIDNAFRGALLNVDVSGWNIGALTSAVNAMLGSSFSSANYNAMLPAWEAQGTSNVVFHAGTAKFSAGAPATARAALISRGWTITDGGLA